ncbi:Fc.00g020140.m01.CDS01 [Cosmosporella sp. VM-42]
MSSSRAWLPLPLPSSPELPVLLVSFDIGTAEYTLHVTDLANMWTETLDRKAICIRGWSENTIIDPSDTVENMSKFLTSLKTALDPSQSGHDETNISLVPGSKSDTGDDGLTLKITCQLPGLPSLKWPMHLKKSPPSAVATGLVLPLVEAHLTRNREVESLVRLLSQKDAIMTKLLDKLEAVGTGLEHVFNPLSGRKKVSRAAAADKVPGLAPFNRRHWKATMEDGDDGPNNTESLVKEVFGGEGLQYNPTMEIDSSPGLDKWWQEFIGISTHKPTRSQTKTLTAKKKTPPPPEKLKDTDDDDFQVQMTPPHLKSTREPADVKMKDLPDDGSTEGEDDSPPPKRPSPGPSSETKKPVSRLGTLGRKKKSPPPRSPSPVQLPTRERTSGPQADDSETASEGEDGTTASLLDEDEPPVPSPPPKSVPRKSGFGRIGGPKPKPPSPEITQTLDPKVGEATGQSTPSTAHKKLGVIGKKKGGDAAASDESRSRSRGVSRQKEEEAKPRETSQERADRKRAELKRELEKKAAAGPAKKKRKF